MKNPLQYVRRNILDLTPYSTARDEYQGELGIFLDANESPYENGVNRYPDPAQKRLKAQIAALKGAAVENLFLGNGSDEAIDLCYRIFCTPQVDNAVAITPSYGMYKVAAAINDVEFREVPLEADFSLSTERLLAAVDEHTRLIWICSPNNPSGNCFPHEQLVKILERFDGMVIVDEAYADFAHRSLVGELSRYPNLIILQTLSKAWGMAGLRVGLAFADSRIIDLFSRVKYPYNINVVTQRMVAEMLDAEELKRHVAEVCSERARVTQRLTACASILEVFPSEANFVLVRTTGADRLYDALIAGGTIVRNRSRVTGCAECLRITIGTPAENDRMLEIIENYK